MKILESGSTLPRPGPGQVSPQLSSLYSQHLGWVDMNVGFQRR